MGGGGVSVLGAAFRGAAPPQKYETLTQFGRFAQDEGVRPEPADGSVVEALVADGPPEAAAAQDVDHVGAGPDRSGDAAAEPQGEEEQRPDYRLSNAPQIFLFPQNKPEGFAGVSV